MNEQDELLLTEKDIVPYLKAKYPYVYKGNDEGWCRMRESALLVLLKSYDSEVLLDAQLAKVKQHYEQKVAFALEDGFNKGVGHERKYGQKRLDGPDREKIAKILKDAIVVGCEVECLNCTLCSENADQILALIPDTTGYISPEDLASAVRKIKRTHEVDIEEAKREERERILKEIGTNAFAEPQHIPQSGREPVIICLTVGDWQALKGEK